MPEPGADESPTPSYRWLGHASIHLFGPPRVTVDPWRHRLDEIRSDLLLVTHGHADHCSEEDLLAAAAEGATLACPAGVADRLRATFPDVRVLAEGDVLELPGVRVTALPMCGPGLDGDRDGFHPRGEGLAYHVELAGRRYLCLGDSVALPEHLGLAPDVLFIAVGGMVVAESERAAADAARVAPRLAVPVHWGDLHARYDAAAEFIAGCEARGIAANVARHATG